MLAHARVGGHDAPADVHRATLILDAAADISRVIGNGAARDRYRAVVEEAAAATTRGRVVSEGAVADVHRAKIVETTTIQIGI
ncbi:MAG: hypothetical protein ACYDER_25480 [Ktedonobacteraceae bacterium]